jgi:sortase A
MKDKKSEKTSKLHIIAGLLLLVTFGSIGFISRVESYVMKYKQQQVLKELDYRSETEDRSNSINVTLAELGKPVAMIVIPKIKLELPVYLGTSDEVLENGIGVTNGTGDIEGGVGKNPLLAGHNGLAEANLFNDLTQVEKGDKFFLKVRDSYHAYEVKTIVEVLAQDLEKNPEEYLLPDEKKDKVTLMTCTPRYINRNRYLVTGERVDYSPKDLKDSANKPHGTFKSLDWKPVLLIIIPAVVVGGVLLIFLKQRRKGYEK